MERHTFPHLNLLYGKYLESLMKTKVYLLNTEEIKDPKIYNSWKQFLPEERWEKTICPMKEEDRKMELAAWLLLYYALKEWGIPVNTINAEGAYYYGDHGKPMRRDRDVYFNLSHSGDYVLCVLSSEEVGCDIEKIREVKWKLAKRFFSEREYDILECLYLKEKNKNNRVDEENIADQASKMFTRFWTLRESYVKKTGEGLGVSIAGLDFSEISSSNGKKEGELLKENFFEAEYDGYCIAVCKEKTGEPDFVVCSAAIDNCFL